MNLAVSEPDTELTTLVAVGRCRHRLFWRAAITRCSYYGFRSTTSARAFFWRASCADERYIEQQSDIVGYVARLRCRLYMIILQRSTADHAGRKRRSSHCVCRGRVFLLRGDLPRNAEHETRWRGRRVSHYILKKPNVSRDKVVDISCAYMHGRRKAFDNGRGKFWLRTKTRRRVERPRRENRGAAAVEGVRSGKGTYPLSDRLDGLRRVIKSPSGVRGGAPAANDFSASWARKTMLMAPACDANLQCFRLINQLCDI